MTRTASSTIVCLMVDGIGPVYHCITVSLYHCVTVSLCHCITVSRDIRIENKWTKKSTVHLRGQVCKHGLLFRHGHARVRRDVECSLTPDHLWIFVDVRERDYVIIRVREGHER
jgi:hypothetical protein